MIDYMKRFDEVKAQSSTPEKQADGYNKVIKDLMRLDGISRKQAIQLYAHWGKTREANQHE